MKSRVRGGNAYTLVHTVAFTSGIKLVPDMCPETQRSVYAINYVANAVGLVNLEMYNNKVWQAGVQIKPDICEPIW